MKLPSVSSTQSRAAIVFVHRPLLSQKQTPVLSSPPAIIIMHCNISTSSASRSRSVCDLGRILQPKTTALNSLNYSAMTYARVTPCCNLYHKAAEPVLSRKKYNGSVARTCFTATSSVTSLTAPLIRAPSSLVLSAHLTPSSAPQRSEEWFALRRDKLTTSTFSTALGFWKGNRRSELWHEKVFPPEAEPMVAARAAMEWGVLNEATAIKRYKSITDHNVSSLGFAVHAEEQLKWLGASPDGLLGCCPGGGILEVKCPYNKGKPELGLPWSTVPFYYMPQVQGQMEIMDREWVDLYCWTPNGSTIFRVCRERGYWELIHGILREFWWENVVPAREALLLGKEEDATAYKPASKHKQTGLAIVKSIKLAAEAKLTCREMAGHIEFTSDGRSMKG